jgi:hypothetical protein
MAELQNRFLAAHYMSPQQKGCELKKIFVQLMKLSDIPVVEPFRVADEQLDGTIKYEGRFYLIEPKWTEA